MIGLVGVTGFAGAGKTTAINHLSILTGGRLFYLGRTVLDEVRARGLSETRESERRVRIELRNEKGRAALAIPYVDEIADCINNGVPALVDAIFNQEEFDLLRSRFPKGPAHVLAVEASFDTRQARLARRMERNFSAEELRERENIELTQLATDAVIASASYRIRNEGTLEEFYCGLAEFIDRCT